VTTKPKKPDLADVLAAQLRALGVPEPQRERRVCADRRWRFDLAWPDQLVACEVDGATWASGRHTRGAGYESDCQKINRATADSWKVYRVTGGMVQSGEAASTIQKALSRGD
jgi:hypothetical protein